MFQRNFLNQEIKTISTIVTLIFLTRIHLTSISLKLDIDYFTCRNSCFQKLHEINSSRNANLLNYFLGDFSTQKQLAQKVKEKYIGRGRNKKENVALQRSILLNPIQFMANTFMQGCFKPDLNENPTHTNVQVKKKMYVSTKYLFGLSKGMGNYGNNFPQQNKIFVI